MATHEDCEAASDAVGWDVSVAEVDAALAAFDECTLGELQALLSANEAEFERRQFRDSVALADEIDQQRIAIAVRTHREANG